LAEEFQEVAGFLSSLDNSQRERFLGDCESRESQFQIWLYACAMGYEGDFIQLEKWLQKRYPQLNRRRMLMAEAIRLESDIEMIRSKGESLKAAEAARNIASLTKELRGHLCEVEKMSRGIDRRGLVLSGADRLCRILEDMFSESQEMTDALKSAFNILWVQLQEER
jgi:hypothetical protein